MDKYEITDDLLFQHCTNVENFILEQIPDEEDIDYEYPKEFEKKIKKIILKKILQNLVLTGKWGVMKKFY